MNEEVLELMDKMATNLTPSEMLNAVFSAINETETTDPEMSRKWRSVSQMCRQSSTPRMQAHSLIRTVESYGISLQELESVMDVAIERKHNTKSHIDHCLTELERVCTDNDVEFTDQIRAGFRGAIGSFAAQVQGTHPEQGTWTNRAQRSPGGGLPPFL